MSDTGDSSLSGDDLVDPRHDDLGRDLEVLLARLAESREAIARLLAARSGTRERVAEEGWKTTIPVRRRCLGTTIPVRGRNGKTTRHSSRRLGRTTGTAAEGGVRGRRIDPESLEARPVSLLRPLGSPLVPAEATGPREPQASSPPLSAPEPLGPKLESRCGTSSAPRIAPSTWSACVLELALIYREIARNGGQAHPETMPGIAVEGPETDGPQLAARITQAFPKGAGLQQAQ